MWVIHGIGEAKFSSGANGHQCFSLVYHARGGDDDDDDDDDDDADDDDEDDDGRKYRKS